ncbi:hypothetical protein NDU88_005645 [Pleurodeles waltl]|uniref:Uncharacterized protein n=1 Tax=Pleurodeles waltl TaxID=8319 RepID=A0AAV7LLS4_PLEWA|nr:hypothetical protein NDU88_005645 [Pleurodeles waltl]
MHSVSVLGAYPSTRDGHRASQPPSGAWPDPRSRPLLGSRATFGPDGGDPASRGPGHLSLLPVLRADAPRVRATRSLSPHRSHVSSPIGPQGARAQDRRAGNSDVLHRAAASVGEPLVSGPAGRRGLGGHLEFIEPAAAGVITAQICRSWYQGESPGSRSQRAPPGQRQ